MLPYMDLHCDTLYEAWCKQKKQICTFPEAMLDGKGLENGGCMTQFFAIFMLQEDDKEKFQTHISDEDYIADLIRIFKNSMGDTMAFAGNLSDIRRNRQEGKISCLLTLEDGRAVDGSMEKLERFYELGIRLISLTWNYVNCFGFPNSFEEAAMRKGLTAFGKDAVVRMQELGMLVDVSHLSDGGFRDVASLCKKPFIASHSNCRSLSPHPRNLTDEMIRTLADHGGIMGLNFCPEFLTKDITNKHSRVEDMVRHLRHMIHIGGEDIAAIGTDLDGIDGHLEIGSPEKMPLLFQALEQAGFTAKQIEKIAWRNAWRVMENLA